MKEGEKISCIIHVFVEGNSLDHVSEGHSIKKSR
jgi:hypothetical protein